MTIHPKLIVAWKPVDQITAVLHLLSRATEQEISYSNLIEPGLDVGRYLTSLVKSGRVIERREEHGPPSYELADSMRKAFVPVDGSSVASRLLRLIKQDPGQSARYLSIKLGYSNPTGTTSAALQRLIGSGQVRRVVTPTGHRHFATGQDQ